MSAKRKMNNDDTRPEFESNLEYNIPDECSHNPAPKPTQVKKNDKSEQPKNDVSSNL